MPDTDGTAATGTPVASTTASHSPPAQEQDAHGPAEDRAPGRTGPALRVMAAVTIVSFLGLWGYVLYLAFAEGRQPPPDRLEDPAFAPAAEARCATALDDIEDLPLANESPTAAHRADVLDEANATLDAMLDDLDGLATRIGTGHEQDLAEAWLSDWRTYLDNRRDYATRLRTDPEARLLVSEKPGEGRHITGWIDEFAKANRMESCVTPGDA